MRNVTKKAMASVLSAALLVGSLLLPGIIRVRAADDAPRFVSEITLTDSDPNTTNTLDKYDLLENPSAGLVLAGGGYLCLRHGYQDRQLEQCRKGMGLWL